MIKPTFQLVGLSSPRLELDPALKKTGLLVEVLARTHFPGFSLSASPELYNSLVSIQGCQHCCRLCDYTTERRDHMYRHLYKHTGERPFKCHLCTKAFTQEFKLNQHMRTHTGERPFSCDLCNASFSRRDHLNYHLTTHAKNRP
ncbi:hypothetical protein HPB51_003032 [Rhipicephalus microplus]|uniref:C2H2-type domain-containing protein n=1 Tax=Rhipicephalus microplus TaxID=6941 RepID=A0A9J6E5S8_RHIMP|nr:hypothetical protein HPB51_003032 [Rhipicephalus microplus]